MQDIVDLIVYYFPSLVTVFTCLGVIFKIVKAFRELKTECLDLKDLENLKADLRVVLQENAELKRQLNETIKAVTKVRRK